MYPFRVFISHASEDTELVELVAVVLQQIGLAPIWDKGIPGGAAFDQEICRRIATAQLFMPLLTPHSAEKAWVHQEIGYALGIDIPILPIAIGILPLAMLSRIQAISVSYWIPTFVKRLSGFSDRTVTSLPLVPALIGIAGLLINGWHSDKSGERVGTLLFHSWLRD